MKGRDRMGRVDRIGAGVKVGNPQTFPLRSSITTLLPTLRLPSGARNMKVPGST
jgi:hypothetical protein